MALMMKTRSGRQKADAAPDSVLDIQDEIQDVVEATETSDEVVAEPKKNWWQRRREVRELAGSFETYPHLLAVKPRERYVFRSDYFSVDGSVGCVLAFFHDDAARDSFAAFWGIDRIPDGLDERVTTVLFEQVQRMDEKWVDSFTKQSERLNTLDAGEQSSSGTLSSRRKADKVAGDLEGIIGELQDGASYLSVHNRLLVKAPDIETLEESIDRITRLFIDRFGTLHAAPYPGEQRQELTGLLRPNEKKRGKGFHFTSTELAGSYSLVTNGLNDRGGEYVGYMVGDINNSAVLMDVNAYSHHAVIADGTFSKAMDRQRVSNMWCSKIGQAAMLENGRVVHLVLDGANLDRLGPSFERLTARVDLNQGDVNMFEMFGEEHDELTVFSAQMEKLKLMFEQLFESTDGSVASIIRSTLEDIATDFYVEQGMWRHNAKENRARLRVVGIPHAQVPRLRMFHSYIATAHKTLVAAQSKDPDQLRALNVLKGIAANMLSTNGDLFDNITADAIDGVRDSRRVVYDFSGLMRRGRGVAMAQLVNIVGFAVGKLGVGDVVIIHGTEQIDAGVKRYLRDQFAHMHERGGRVVYSYNDVDQMLEDTEFNKFDAADFTVFGPMREKTVETYQKLLAQEIPPDLAQLITGKETGLSYLRRGHSNVVFYLDLALGTNPAREAQRRKVRLEAAKAEENERMAQILKSKPVPGASLTSIRQDVEAGEVTADATGSAAAQRRQARKGGLGPSQSAGADNGVKAAPRRELGRS